jgi:hypothetical protein
MTEKFKVLLAGIPDGSNYNDVVQNLSRLFKTDPAKIEALLKKAQAVIKTDLTKEAAGKYMAALEKAGALAKVVPVAPVAPSSPDPSPMKMEREEEEEEKEAEKGPEPKAVCPGCGYEAMSSDDPLITAHDGEGECPQCGVVPKKVIKAQEEQAQEDIPAGDAKIIGAKSGSGLSGGSIARFAIIAVVILAIAAIWYSFGRQKSVTKERENAIEKVRAVANKPLGVPDEQEEGSTKAKGPACMIQPGESRTFTLTGPVPYIHYPGGAAQIRGAYGIALDEVSRHGIEVDVVDSQIYSEQNMIWTAGVVTTIIKTGEKFTTFRPVLTDGRLAQFSVDRKTGAEILTSPIRVGNSGKLISMAEMSIDDAKKGWRRGPDLQVTGFQKDGYAFYYFSVTFTVNVPPQEELEAAHNASRIDRQSLGFGPTKLVFTDGDVEKVLAKGDPKNQISVLMSVYRNTGKIMGLNVDCYKQGYTMTCE